MGMSLAIKDWYSIGSLPLSLSSGVGAVVFLQEVPPEGASVDQLMGTPPQTTPLEQMTMSPQLANTLEHIVGQLDILTQVHLTFGKNLNLDPLRLLLTQSGTRLLFNTCNKTLLEPYSISRFLGGGGIVARGNFRAPPPSV